MKKLEIELIKVFETGLTMRVIHQDNSLLSDIGSITTIYRRDDYSLISAAYPELEMHDCYVRGYSKNAKDTAFFDYDTQKDRDAMYDFIIEAMEHINKPEPLTFDRIRKECVPMKHLLVKGDKYKYLYLGFTRSGKLITDNHIDHTGANTWWYEDAIKDFTIEEYKG